MRPLDDRTSAVRIRPAELAAAALALAVTLVAQVWLTDSWILLTRPFWLDEIYTHALVTDPSLAHAGSALASGVETHPPALYLLLRGWTWLLAAGGALGLPAARAEVALRSFALLSALLALVGLYACLRRCFASWACLGAVLGIWCHPLVLHEAFNARFYCPWLAAIAWYGYFLVGCRASGPALRTRLAVALGAVLTCTLHYFGILSLALVTAGEVLARRRVGRRWTPGLGAAAAGPLALACCLPLLRCQRAAFSVATWMDPLDIEAIASLFVEYLQALPVAWMLLFAWLSVATQRTPEAPPRQPDQLWGLTALLGLPLCLLAFSIVLPAYQPRYSFPALAGLAAAAGWLSSRCRRPWAIALAVLLVLQGALAVRLHGRMPWAQWTLANEQLMSQLRVQARDAPVVFESPSQAYIVWRYAPDLRPRSCLLDFEPADHLGNAPPNRLFMRDLARRYFESYGGVPLKPWSEVRHWQRFYLVSADFGKQGAGVVVDAFYPGFHVRRLGRELYELSARTR